MTKDEIARILHEAKMRECYMPGSSLMDKQPWEKPNAAAPNQPWHDVAIAQAEALMKVAEIRRKP